MEDSLSQFIDKSIASAGESSESDNALRYWQGFASGLRRASVAAAHGQFSTIENWGDYGRDATAMDRGRRRAYSAFLECRPGRNAARQWASGVAACAVAGDVGALTRMVIRPPIIAGDALYDWPAEQKESAEQIEKRKARSNARVAKLRAMMDAIAKASKAAKTQNCEECGASNAAGATCWRCDAIPGVPRPISIGDLIERSPELRPPVVAGLLRVGETMNIVASPKVGKSWLVLDLALSVATGRDWLGTYETTPGRVGWASR